MTPLTPLLRAFRSEMLKYRSWNMFAGTGIMLVVSAFLASLTFHQITSGVTGQEVDPLAHARGKEQLPAERGEEGFLVGDRQDEDRIGRLARLGVPHRV